MLIHVGMLTLVDSATQQQRSAICDRLHGLVGEIPGLVNVATGVNLDLKPDTASVLFQLTFDSEESWRMYADHPAHKAVISEAIAPVLKSKLFIQVAELN